MKTKKPSSTVKKPLLIKAEYDLRTSPRDVFVHLLMMAMLYVVVVSLLSLAFNYINFSFPDALAYYRSGILDGIRMTSSMLVISFPILLFLTFITQRDLRKNPAKHELRFSKWLTYLTLFLSAITIVIDLIQLVNRFYGGELTTPFILKVLSVLMVAGGVFGYYLWYVQKNPVNSKVPGIVGWISSVIVLGMLISGFLIVGSPSHQRDLRMDERRVNDLQALHSEIISHWQRKGNLPDSLDGLRNDFNGFTPPVDPETKLPYEYLVREPLVFSLCGTFKQQDFIEYTDFSAPVYYNGNYDMWQHEAGRYCFERTIDPTLYPKNN